MPITFGPGITATPGITFVPPLETGSMSFNGTNQYASISSPASNLINWYSTSYTVEYWIRPNSFSQGGNSESPVIGNMDPTNSSTGTFWSFGPITGGTVKFYYFNGGLQFFSTAATVSTGVWTHLAFVNNANALTIYINGVSRATATISGTPQSGSSLPLSIGSAYTGKYDGLLTNVRLTASAVYTSNFTPSTLPLTNLANTRLLLLASNSGNLLTDSSTNNNTLTNNNGVSWNSQSPFL